MLCLFVEYMEYRAWRRRTYGEYFDGMGYANFLEAYREGELEAGMWQEGWRGLE